MKQLISRLQNEVFLQKLNGILKLTHFGRCNLLAWLVLSASLISIALTFALCHLSHLNERFGVAT